VVKITKVQKDFWTNSIISNNMKYSFELYLICKINEISYLAYSLIKLGT
jgi:hypothetical protein